MTTTHRSYWIPGSYAPTWSEKRTSLFKAIEKEGLQGGKGDNNWVVRQRHIHDPRIQQEPALHAAPHLSDPERLRNVERRCAPMRLLGELGGAGGLIRRHLRRTFGHAGPRGGRTPLEA